MLESARTTLLRWIDIVLVGLMATAVVYLLLPSLHRLVANLPLPTAHTLWLVLATIPLLAALAVSLGRTGCFRFDKRSFRYPSVAWGVLIGSGILFVGSIADDDVVTPAGVHLIDWMYLVLTATLALLTASVYGRFQRHLDRCHSNPPANEPVHQSSDLLRASPVETLEHLVANPNLLSGWLKTDTPIASAKEDMLGVQASVARLAKALQETPSQTIGLLGRFGVGKTSLVQMTEQQLNASSSVHLVWVGSWGLKPESLPLTVLRAGVEAVRPSSVKCRGTRLFGQMSGTTRIITADHV